MTRCIAPELCLYNSVCGDRYQVHLLSKWYNLYEVYSGKQLFTHR